MKKRLRSILSVLVLSLGLIAASIEIFDFYKSHKENHDDLTGKWELTVKITESDKQSYVEGGLTVSYILFLTINNSSIIGSGEKDFEIINDTTTKYKGKQRTKVDIKGITGDGGLDMILEEEGTIRNVVSTIKIQDVDSTTKLRGTYSTTAANSNGTARLEKM
jgi:hypothetical protein